MKPMFHAMGAACVRDDAGDGNARRLNIDMSRFARENRPRPRTTSAKAITRYGSRPRAADAGARIDREDEIEPQSYCIQPSRSQNADTDGVAAMLHRVDRPNARPRALLFSPSATASAPG